MKVLIFLATLGCALALQAPVEYVYRYEAKVGTGIHSSRPTYSGTAIKAKVKFTLQEPGVATVQMSEVQVGEGQQELRNNGRSPLQVQYSPIQDKAVELPFKAYLKRNTKETVMEVPETDLLWVTNVRRGVVNAFRLAPLLDPSSVRPSLHSSGNQGSQVPPQTFSRMEDTYAGRCRVSYTIAPKPRSERVPTVHPDIQSKSSPRGPAGRQIQLEEQFYRLVSSIDFSSCQQRPVFLQTGVANLTNVTDSIYRDAASRSYVMTHLLKGSPGSFRIEQGVLESMYIFNPYGVDSEKMVIISNQTLTLESTVPVSRYAGQIQSQLKQVKTWQHQVQSPNRQPQNGAYVPDYIVYKPETSEQPHSPIFYERMVTGFGFPQQKRQEIKEEVWVQLQKVSQQLFEENKMYEQDQQYGGSQDGAMAQRLVYLQKLIRTLPQEQLRQLDSQIRQQAQSCRSCEELFVDLLQTAGSGPALELLTDKISNRQVSQNRTSVLFFHLVNNIQSPEGLHKLVDLLKSDVIKNNPSQRIISKLSVALATRRLCLSPQIRPYSAFLEMYGDKTCDKNRILSAFLPVLHRENSGQAWEQLVDVYVAAALGDDSVIRTIGEIAQGQKYNQDVMVRIAACHSLSSQNFDNSSYSKIINYLLPIAESQREDYRVRQMAYFSILTFRPNATVIQRMAESTLDEPSNQMRTFVYWVLNGLARTTDRSFRQQAVIAKSLLPIVFYMNPSSQRTHELLQARYIPEDDMGSNVVHSWTTSYQTNFPLELYDYIAGSYGGVKIPFAEYNWISNTGATWTTILETIDNMSKPRAEKSEAQKQREHHVRQQFFENVDSVDSTGEVPAVYMFFRMFLTSEAILPMTDEHTREFSSAVKEVFAHMKDGQRNQIINYFNPVEITMVLPSPPGLWSLTEVSAPTILFADISGQFMATHLIPNVAQLPQLPRFRVEVDGITKVVSKLNTWSYVYAPWTNKTVVAAVDNEKSISLPYKLEVGSSYKLPDQTIWGQLTPKIQQQGKAPIAMVRNIPYVAIGKAFPTPLQDAKFKMQQKKKVLWISDDERRTDVTIPLSQTVTGLNAEIKYQSETYFPLVQVNYVEYLQEPARLLNLFASPSIKSYNLTLFKLPGQSQETQLGFRFRHVVRNGTGSPIEFPQSSKSVVDLDCQDSHQSRINKIAKFSNVENHEISLMFNVTKQGQQPRIFEGSLLRAYDERSRSSEIKDTYRKYQVTFMQKRPDMSSSAYKPKAAWVGVIDRPQPLPLASVEQQFIDGSQSLFRQLVTKFSADIYEGQDFASGTSSIAQSTGKLWVSPLRGSYIQRLVGEQSTFTSPMELYRIAVYDRLDLDVKYQPQSFSRGLLNVTYRVQDLAEGFLFPTILKNHFSSNQQQRIQVQANRTISDDRITASVKLPQTSLWVRGAKVHPVFDWVTGYTGEVFVHQNQKLFLRSQGPYKSCYVHASQVKTFDGVNFQKEPSTCQTIVSKILTPEEHILVLAKHQTATESSEQEVRILSTRKGIDVKLVGTEVQVHNEPMAEQTKVIRDEAGVVVCKITKIQGLTKVELPSKLMVVLKEGKTLAIELNPRFKNSVQGMCGDYNTDSVEDMRGPSGCIYNPSLGKLFAADWIAKKDQCQEQKQKQLIQELTAHKQTCTHSRRRISSGFRKPSQCEVNGYLIAEVDRDFLCVYDTKPVRICGGNCRAQNRRPEPMNLKCWEKRKAPQEVKNNLKQGYITEHVDAPGHLFPATANVPTSCVPEQLSYPQPPYSDQQCRLQQVYPLRQNGPLMCIAVQPRQLCKPSCNAGDTRQQQVLANCWNIENSPNELIVARDQGYLPRPPQQQPQVVKMVPFDLPSYCFTSSGAYRTTINPPNF